MLQNVLIVLLIIILAIAVIIIREFQKRSTSQKLRIAELLVENEKCILQVEKFQVQLEMCLQQIDKLILTSTQNYQVELDGAHSNIEMLIQHYEKEGTS